MRKSLSHQEVEMTAVLSEKEFNHLKSTLAKRSKKTKSQKRFMMRFHKGKVNVRDPLDIRYKWTNGEHELVIKKGALGSQLREEMSIPFGKENKYDYFIRLFSLLGYQIGNVMYRETEKYETETVEIAFVIAYPYYCIEVEALHVKTKKDAVEKVMNFFKEHGIIPLSKSDYQSFLRLVDRNVNYQFPLGNYPQALVEKEYWKTILEKTVFS